MRKFAVVLAAATALTASSMQAQTFYGLDNVSGITGSGGTATNSNSARAQFLSFLSSTVQTETFEGFSVGTVNPNLSFVGSGPTISATLTGNGEVRLACNAGACPINPGLTDQDPRFFRLSTGAGSEFSVKFNQTVAAFGVDGSDISDAGSSFFVQFLLGGTALSGFGSPFNVTNSGSLNTGNQLFFGYINTGGFDEVRFSSNSSGDNFGFDNMTVGDVRQVSSVPEPASFALVGAGLLGLVGVARRRRA
jgi:hypothetical protein